MDMGAMSAGWSNEEDTIDKGVEDSRGGSCHDWEEDNSDKVGEWVDKMKPSLLLLANPSLLVLKRLHSIPCFLQYRRPFFLSSSHCYCQLS